MVEIGTILSILGIIILVLIVLMLLTRIGYVKARPDEVVVISGLGKAPKFVRGRSAFMIPILQRRDTITLQLVDVDLQINKEVPTADFIGVTVDAAVNVKIDASNQEKLRMAAENFLGMSSSEIVEIVRPVLEGNVREIIGKMNLREMVTNKDEFAKQVRESAEPDMAALGLTINTFNVQNFADQNGVIKALGVDNEAQIKKDAAVSSARNKQIIREETAKAEQAANEAEVESEAAIAASQNALRIKKADLKKDSDAKQAAADIAYKIQEESQRKILEQASVDADIARQEREIELEEKRVAVEQKKLEAEVNKKAEAERYRAEQEAEAQKYRRERDAEAAKIEQENDAEAKLIQAQRAAEAELVKAQNEAKAEKARAEASRYAKEQEAAGIAAVGKAEAEAIEAKGVAEAEAILKKAEAMKQYGQAAMVEMIIKALPEMAANIAKPMENISDVRIYGGSDGTGIDSVSNVIPAQIAKTFDTIREFTGIDFVDIMGGQGKAAQTDRNLHVGFDAEAKAVLNGVKKVAEALEDEKPSEAEQAAGQAEEEPEN